MSGEVNMKDLKEFFTGDQSAARNEAIELREAATGNAPVLAGPRGGFVVEIKTRRKAVKPSFWSTSWKATSSNYDA